MKRKNGQFKFDTRVLQWAIIAVILCVVMSWFNMWWFWWLPFVMIGGGSCAIRHDSDAQPEAIPVEAKRKNDDIV